MIKILSGFFYKLEYKMLLVENFYTPLYIVLLILPPHIMQNLIRKVVALFAFATLCSLTITNHHIRTFTYISKLSLIIFA